MRWLAVPLRVFLYDLSSGAIQDSQPQEVGIYCRSAGIAELADARTKIRQSFGCCGFAPPGTKTILRTITRYVERRPAPWDGVRFSREADRRDTASSHSSDRTHPPRQMEGQVDRSQLWTVDLCDHRPGSGPLQRAQGFSSRRSDRKRLWKHICSNGYEGGTPLDEAVRSVFENVGEERCSYDRGVLTARPEQLERIEATQTLNVRFKAALELARKSVSLSQRPFLQMSRPTKGSGHSKSALTMASTSSLF